MSWVNKQILEIDQDSNLKNYTYFLIAIHFFTAIFWQHQNLSATIQNFDQAVCWPFLSSCQLINGQLNIVLQIMLYLYFTISTVGIFLFSEVKKLWWLLLTLEVLKVVLEFTDYRTMGNYHFMPHLVTIYFLFIPNKKFWIFLWLAAFYLAAASLKFNLEWLSGASLAWKIPFNNLLLLQTLAFLVIPIELIAGFCLLLKTKKLLFVALLLLIPFHLVSFYWVGYFYPAVMSCLLSFVFFELKNANLKKQSLNIQYEQVRPILRGVFWGWPFFIFYLVAAPSFYQCARVFFGRYEKTIFTQYV